MTATVKIPFNDSIAGIDEVYYDHYEMTDVEDYLRVIDDCLDHHFGAVLIKEEYCISSPVNFNAISIKPDRVTRYVFDDIDEAKDQLHYEIGSTIADHQLDTVQLSLYPLTAMLSSPSFGTYCYRIRDLSELKNDVETGDLDD